jgi:hypothetical protein
MVSTMRLPQRVIDLARAELQRRLSVPESDVGVRQRARLEARLAKLAQLYSWGDLSEPDYRREQLATRDLLAAIPDESRVVAFDRNRRVIESMAENVEAATLLQRQELARLLIERVEVRHHEVESVVWTGPTRPFFAVGAPPDGLEPPTQALGRPRSVH